MSSDRTLRDLLRTDGRLSFDRATQILADVAESLATMHATGQAHGAITPLAVHLDDVGHATLGQPAADITMAALLPVAYLPPERIDGATADPRGDVYTLGLLGWEMLAGRTPWADESLHDVVLHQQERDLPSLTTMRPGVPRSLLLTIEGALHKHSADRWADAGEMLHELRPTSVTEPERVEATPVDAVAVGHEKLDQPAVVIQPIATSRRPRSVRPMGRRLGTLALVIALLVSTGAAIRSLQTHRRRGATVPWMDSVATSTSAGVVIVDDTTHGSSAPVRVNRTRPVRAEAPDTAPPADTLSPDVQRILDRANARIEADRRRYMPDSAADSTRADSSAKPDTSATRH